MFVRCREIVRLLLLGCIVVQLTWLTGGSTPDDKKTTDDLRRRIISWSDPAAEPHSRIILPSNLDPRLYPIFKIHMYHKYKINPVEIESIMEDNGGEKLKDRQARTHVPAKEISDHRERNYVRIAQGEISRTTDERNSSAEEETKVDLSFLDNLGGLAPYLPDVEDSKAPDTLPNKEASSDNWYQGIFNWFLSKLGITSKATNVNGMAMVREGFYYINKTLEKPDETKTYLLPKVRGRYVEASWTSVDPRKRVRLIAELDRGNLTFISEIPILHPTNSKVTTSPSIAPSSHDAHARHPRIGLIIDNRREKIDFHLDDIYIYIYIQEEKSRSSDVRARRQIVPRDDESSSRVLSFSPCRVAPRG
ncbi:uncharacterized protein LOC114940211 isoform X2 [Nylanderia fulva]|uniref:uncharacterized protein LOC114940211 isoform X2 n=1 Tax=Nylanderia fulva TaxID=613905 RepID=UPI0010FB59BC|nr:uncharacterized protein LOC114940211 isoform X2 [Nylanderia fulva]